jgi:hypothetical protein
VGALTVAHAQSIEGANGPVKITLETIEFNAAIDAANFEVPAGIAALMNPAAKPAAAPAAAPAAGAAKPAAAPAADAAKPAAAPAAPKPAAAPATPKK